MSGEKKPLTSTTKYGSVLVIGGGIAGIQSALDLADAGFKIYIVDRGLSIGGTMTQLDKTFPTNDCAMCILAPKLVYTGRHQNIDIITNAEVTKIEGESGCFHATITKHPRYVDLEKCNGCGDCVEHCPVSIVSDFDEELALKKAIYQPFPQAIPNAFAIAKKEGISPCKIACPAGLNVQGFIALASQEKFAEAFDLIKEKMPLPGSLGRICYHPCETECNRKDIEEPLSICKIRRFIADYIYEHQNILDDYLKKRDEKRQQKDTIKPDIKRGNKQKVAIIGAGPAGLTAASDLAHIGYHIVIFEAEKDSGGMLCYGVPEYRLPKEYLSKEINLLINEGNITIKHHQHFGKDFNLADLRKQGYKATFIAIGAHKGRAIDITCCQDSCVLDGVSYLKDLNSGKLSKDYFKEKKVLVIGGGNVAMDSARTAKRLGGDVTVLYRRTIKEMPAHREEVTQAEEEGITFKFLTNPLELLKKEKGKGTCLKCIKMELGNPDESGRRKPIPVKGSDFTIDCDVVIFAIGQQVDTSDFEKNKITVTKNGLIAVDSISLQTSQKDVFAGGDAVTGPASAVEAIGAGHDAAVSIDRFLNDEDLKKGREQTENEKASLPNEAPRFPLMREIPSSISSKERIKSFSEIDKGFTFEQVVREAKRCLNCAGCCECLQCVLHCGRDAIDHHMLEMIEEIDVGAVIVSPGYDEYIPPHGDSYGYMVYPNVLTSIEFERMLSASGPYKGHIQRMSDGKTPKKDCLVTMYWFT